jgi:hypothetical protein
MLQTQTLLEMITKIEIRPHRWGWKAFVFPEKDDAISYAQQRAAFALFDLDFRRDLGAHQ